MFATVLTSGLLSRPSQAELLNPVTNSVGCMLNISACPTTPVADPPPSTDPGKTADPNPTPTDDTTVPSVAVTADPKLAGGNTQTITITGAIFDDHLASYSLAIDGNIAQAESNMTTTSASISVPWNVSSPNVVPSGSYLITLDATDASGNTSHDQISVEVDNTPPDVTIDGGDVIIKSGSISPMTTADDKNGIASYSWTADSNNPAVIDFVSTVAEPTFTPNIEGSYIYYVDVADGLGNVTRKQFNFGYAQELATVPLPTTQDPTDALVDQSPSTPAVTPANSDPIMRSGRDEITTGNDSGVLGNTITAPGQTSPTTTVATIASTSSGWSIFGLLWYWWILILAALTAIAWYVIAAIRRRNEGQV
ncbi:MAG TPA: hypothetical protein VIM31_04950 [Candidatus Microsaccharimonas sp.]|jgi:hypothetical protein